VTDSDEDFLEVKEAEANEQHKTMGSNLLLQSGNSSRLIFEVRNRGLVVESDFYAKLQKPDV